MKVTKKKINVSTKKKTREDLEDYVVRDTKRLYASKIKTRNTKKKENNEIKKKGRA